MKILYSSLRCPHCGSKKFNIFEGDIFLCEYCNQKFNYDLEEIDFSSENKIFIEELKQEFYDKINELNKEKVINNFLVIRYSKLSYPRKLTATFLICFLISLFALFTGQFILPFTLSTTIFLVLYVLAKWRSKKMFEKYAPLASLCASRVVELDGHINTYSRFISKLSK